MSRQPDVLGRLTSTFGAHGGSIVNLDIVDVSVTAITRLIRVLCPSQDAARLIATAVAAMPGVELQMASDRTFQLHRRGKIEVQSRLPIRNAADLAQVHHPGSEAVARKIAEHPEVGWRVTSRSNTVAVVTDGSAVLGLGDVGPAAAMPVMEGKAMLFKAFADIDAWPICLDAREPDEIVRIVTALAPSFGAILLEDISSPRCFEVEERLEEALDIPVFHDDQHGTAVVVGAAMLNALRVVGKRPEDVRLVVLGLGAAGMACTQGLMRLGIQDVIGFDREGAIHQAMEGLNRNKQWFADHTNQGQFTGSLEEALRGADIFLGLSGPGLLKPEWVAQMAPDPIVFALANPEPEVLPSEIEGLARVVATGRSDFPNQVNNILCFPGLFRGALDARATRITPEMKAAATRAIADSIPADLLSEEYILPSTFNPAVATAVADAVMQEAQRSGHVRPAGPRILL
ncbi:MAG: NAD-dependent malic enzyme [Dehalococcoidia bacterium]|nr:NAD-dependent malic enzyme [Dehalococcoidia bacterium]